MPILNSQMFFLGNISDMDTNEGNSNTENVAAILGSYSQPPLIDVAVDDIDGDGAIWDDEIRATSEDFTYDTGSGSTSQLLDSTQTYMADVLLGDGSTSSIEVTVIQLQNGDVFLTEFANNGTLDNLSVQSVELVSVTGSNYSGFFSNSSVDNTTVVCFTPGTLIDTNCGPAPVETLRPGHHVRTLDHGYQPIRWVGYRNLWPADLAANPQLRPIIIRKGALGNDRRMLVSPQHGFLIDGHLIRAKHLAENFGGKVARVDRKSENIKYIHFLCDHHEIVFANGTATESLYPGPQALRSMGQEAIEELSVLFPELTRGRDSPEAVKANYGCPARQYMTGGEVRRRKKLQFSALRSALGTTKMRPEFIPKSRHTATKMAQSLRS